MKNKLFTIVRGYILPVTILILGLSAIDVDRISERASPPATLEGRWDITVQDGAKESPSWLEVTHSGLSTLVGHFVGITGSSRPISRIQFDGTKFSFTIPPQWEEGDDLRVEGTVEGDKISGTMITPEGKNLTWTGVRAPSLRQQKPVVWGTPIKLFNGKNLDGWKTDGENQWVAENGVLKSPKSGSNIYTTRKFNNFKLHLEFRYPKGSNSGVYLRGRYEVQVSDSKGLQPSIGDLGAIYGFIAPAEMVAKNPGEWQTYDITLIGRTVTVVGNGKTIICGHEIPGITGGAIDSKEGEPGPIMFQGDHGPVEYRNIVITPAK